MNTWYPTADDKLFLYLQGKAAQATEGFCSFLKGSPPPDNPKTKGVPSRTAAPANPLYLD